MEGKGLTMLDETKQGYDELDGVPMVRGGQGRTDEEVRKLGLVMSLLIAGAAFLAAAVTFFGS